MLNGKKLPLLIAASVLGSGSATVVGAQDFSGGLELGYWNTDRTSTDTDIVGSPFNGVAVGGFLTTTVGNGIRVTADGRYEVINDEGLNDVYESGPVHTGVLGLHAGKAFDGLYAGAYAGLGFFDGYNSDSPMTGRTFGIEAEYTVSPTLSVFAQAGYARAIGHPGDNEFKGLSTRVGASAKILERLTASLTYEFARSHGCFEDCGGDWGRYRAIGVEVAYQINDRFDLLVGYEDQAITANTEDTGSAKNFFLGVRTAFGGAKRQNNLATPMGAFNAAGWMEPLD